ncbi:MAG: hypothetical protein LBR81_03010 [Prevotellaceae bacterium]|jgi:hypothetical protein|nr:hypothetical protein [Prevotellaceae bacterium]
MRKTLILLSLLALLANGCKQAAKKQADTVNNKTVNKQIDNVKQYGGIYTYGNDKDSEAPKGEVYMYPETDSTALFYLFESKGAPSYNMGSIDGRITIHNGKATFRKRFDYAETDCVLRFEFNENTLTVTEDENDCECGFGYGVYVNDTFKRSSTEIPQYYTTLTNEKAYFSEWREEMPENEESSEEKYYVTESAWESVQCRKYQEDDGYTNIQECVFPNANLQQVYTIVKKLNPNLKSELPVSDIKYPSTEEGCIEVEYQYKTENHLFIKLFYNGGVTYVEIIEKENETQSKITYSAD